MEDEDIKAEVTRCSFCQYERPELERIDNGKEEDDPGYGFGDFCAVCSDHKRRALAAYFAPWEFRFDIEQIRIACYNQNEMLDHLAELKAHAGYTRTHVNELSSTVTALAQRTKSIMERMK